MTVFPTVSEPHILSRDMASKNATPNSIIDASNQMLVTIALLQPDARHHVELNRSNPIEYPPVLLLPPNRTRWAHHTFHHTLCIFILELKNN